MSHLGQDDRPVLALGGSESARQHSRTAVVQRRTAAQSQRLPQRPHQSLDRLANDSTAASQISALSPSKHVLHLHRRVHLVERGATIVSAWLDQRHNTVISQERLHPSCIPISDGRSAQHEHLHRRPSHLQLGWVCLRAARSSGRHPRQSLGTPSSRLDRRSNQSCVRPVHSLQCQCSAVHGRHSARRDLAHGWPSSTVTLRSPFTAKSVPPFLLSLSLSPSHACLV